MLKPIFVFIVGLSLAISGYNGTANLSANGGVESASNAGAAKPIENESGEVQSTPNSDEQLSPFVRRIFQDKSGNLWFGTNGDGVIRYDGDALKYFSINEGFGGVAVRGIVEDKEGNVWFGTEGGITRYDPSAELRPGGNSFTNFAEKDGLVNDDVWSIVIDSKGIIWIGTLQGVSRFDGKEFTPFELPESKPDPTRGVTSAKIVHSIMEDSKGKMWFGTNGGAYIYDGKNLSSLSEKDGLCSNAVNCILEDKNGNFWFATHHKGVCHWDGKSFTHFTKKDGVEGTEAWDLYEDKSGNIWFPIENSGVYRYDGKSFTNFQKEQGLTTNAIQCTFEDKEGRLWLGGWKGLFRYDGKSIFSVGKNGPWQGQNKTDLPKDTKGQPKQSKNNLPDEVDAYFVESQDIKGIEHKKDTEELSESGIAPASIRFDAVLHIFEDSSGNFWFGNSNKGVCRFDGKHLTNFTEKVGLGNIGGNRFQEDRNGVVWFESENGIYSYDGEKFTTHTDIDYSSKNDWKSETNDLWFGGVGGYHHHKPVGQPGIVRYHGGKLTFLAFPVPPHERAEHLYLVTTPAVKGKNAVWFATFEMVIGFNGESFTLIGREEMGRTNDPRNMGIRALFEDSDGNLWMGDNGSGVFVWDGETTTDFTKKHGLRKEDTKGSPSLDRLFSIAEDKAGNMWFGTYQSGAWRFDGKSLTNFGAKDGLESKSVMVVYKDRRGDMWFGGESPGGIYKFNGTSFDRMH